MSMIRKYELNNIIATIDDDITNSTENAGVVNIQFNIDGFNETIRVVAGYDYNGDDEDGRIFYADEPETLVRTNAVKETDYNHFNLHCIINSEGEECYYDGLMDFVVDSIFEYFQKGNRFITAIINYIVFKRLTNK